MRHRHRFRSVVFLLLLAPAALYAAETLVVDQATGRIRLSGRVAKQNVYAQLKGAIEYIACCPGGKEYESLFVCAVDPAALHKALAERLGLKPGQPARWQDDNNRLPDGAPVRILVEWKAKNTTRTVPVETLVTDARRQAGMVPGTWVFTGSQFTTEPGTGRRILQAQIVKNLIALHHLDPTVLFQNATTDAQDDDRYKANLTTLPPEGTPITLIIESLEPVRTTVPPAKARRIHGTLHGRVQGVGFRAFTQRHARRIGVRGWVRNLPDGTVELMAEGAAEMLAAFEQKIRKGPRGARVDRVELAPTDNADPFSDFRILPTPIGGSNR